MSNPIAIRTLCAALLCLISSGSWAQNVYDWDGGGGSTTWWTANNWAPDTAITAINGDANAVLRFAGSPTATPNSMGLPGNSQIVVQQIWFEPGFNALQTSEIVLGASGAADLQLRGANPMFRVDAGLVTTNQSTGSEVRLNGDATFAIGGELRVLGAIINNTPSQPASLLKTGSGVLVLRGNNTMGGAGKAVQLIEGVLDINTDNQLGAATNALIFKGAIEAPATLRIDAQGGNRLLARPISVDTSGGYRFDIRNTDSTGVTISDHLDMGSFGNPALLRKLGNGTLRLTGQGTFSRIQVQDGRLVQAGAEAISTWPGTVIDYAGNATGVLSLGGHDTEVASLIASDGNAGIIENGASQDMTLSITGMFDERYGGVLRDGASGKLSLRVAGAFGSTQTLSGNNSYTGPTTVQGRLHLAHVSALGSTSAPTTVDANGNLSMTDLQLNEPLILAGGVVRNVLAPASTLNGPVTLTANSQLAGDGNSLNIAGGIDLGSHRLETSGHVVLDASTVAFAAGADVQVRDGLVELYHAERWHNAEAAPPFAVGAGSSLIVHHDQTLVNLANDLALTGPGNGDSSLRFETSDGQPSVIYLSGALSLTNNVCVGASASTAIRIEGVISGSGRFCKTGTNTVTIATAPTLTGGILIEDGELQVNATLPSDSLTTVLGVGCCDVDHPLGTVDGQLSGTGNVGNLRLEGGTVSPGGSSVGTLAGIDATVSAVGATFRFQLGGDPANPDLSDRLLLNQLAIESGGRIGISLSDGVGMPMPGRYRLIETVQTHNLALGDFELLPYQGDNADFGGTLILGPNVVDFQLQPVPQFVDGFE
ncbi:autotransporter-associated beta strand repeat-containing protein [Ahniella affigens]|nr:autotransporter-associated beta strand repeat-containing protein [Ahniella affigens]